jgi:hypothetical protein
MTKPIPKIAPDKAPHMPPVRAMPLHKPVAIRGMASLQIDLASLTASRTLSAQ